MLFSLGTQNPDPIQYNPDQMGKKRELPLVKQIDTYTLEKT